ncbi:hypothetical protein G7K_2304-t1 [Saitoella complicata NRRL Y-17804]|uniref:Uncharacterized protein n=2 Tax=Saitoella complicata (strain BCRC 22490 / CBS 7301 / JCM 7358 / NBRC 10748 / NRRL Y-17804) TaxID=698492 RepID=A0A0E9NFD5_SAICN|nr:hypothetical protein G7K_2304-t1 [Saitoella complicata NRRL Y-17804]
MASQAYPQQYQQGYGQPYGQPQQYAQPAPGMAAPPQNPAEWAQMQQQQQQQYVQQPGTPGVDGISQQMNQMTMGVPPTAAPRAKRPAHAYHTDLLETTPSNPVPLPPQQAYYAGGQQQPEVAAAAPGQQPQGQFPAPASEMFVPAVPESRAQYDGVQRPGAAGKARIDFDSLPSLPDEQAEDQAKFLAQPYGTLERSAPPLASTDFAAVDQGNANPKFARLTMTNIPATDALLEGTHLPFGMVIQPMAALRHDEESVPVLQPAGGPPRCRRCKAYINAFCSFVEGGSKWVCNMCSFPNDVASEYFAPVDFTGRRMDIDQRPELCKGSVEFVVGKEYYSREPGPLHYIFAIDVSESAVKKGIPELAADALRRTLYGGPEVEGTRLPAGAKVSIITFDRTLHFYNLSPGLEQAQMMVMSEVEDVFVPLAEGMFVDPVESRTVIESLLNVISNMFNSIKIPEPAFASVIQASLAALEKLGGKLSVFLSTLPTWGPGRLRLREETKWYNTDKEKLMFAPQDQLYTQLGQKCVETGVGVDVWLFGSGYMDVATLGTLSSMTGGDTYFYPNWVAERDGPKFSSEVEHSIIRETGYQALMRVRCSNGIRVTHHHGNFFQRNPSDLEFGTVDADKAIAVMFKHDGKLEDGRDAYFQSALLYTTATGERRVRVHNVCAQITSKASDIIRMADADACVAVMAKEAAAATYEKTLENVRAALTKKCIKILAAYRKNVSGSAPPAQLVLPETFKLLPVQTLGILKLRAFRGGMVSSDMRVYGLRLVRAMGVKDFGAFIYPRLYGLHSMTDEDCFPDENGVLKVPQPVRPSYSKLDEGGVYLAENGQNMFLWFHSRVSPNFLRDLYGESVSSLKELNPTTNEIPELESRLNVQVRNLIRYIQSRHSSKSLSPLMSRQGLDGSEHEFASWLVEDRNCENMNYVDYLCHVHKHIQLELSGAKNEDSSPIIGFWRATH